MKSPDGDDFYVGYANRVPGGHLRVIRATVTGLLAMAALLASVFGWSQRTIGAGVFEYAAPRDFQGVLEMRPYPVLRVDAPSESASAAYGFGFPVVYPGKDGGWDRLRPFGGFPVSLSGSLIYRGGQAMIEAEPGSLRRVSPPANADRPSRGLPGSADMPARLLGNLLGNMTLRGEIVDSKCYLGVMNPGNGKPHRSCASLCIRGGIPPALLVQGQEGSALFLLVDADGGAVNARVLGMAGRTAEIAGRVVRYDDVLVLSADPAEYRLIGE